MSQSWLKNIKYCKNTEYNSEDSIEDKTLHTPLLLFMIYITMNEYREHPKIHLTILT